MTDPSPGHDPKTGAAEAPNAAPASHVAETASDGPHPGPLLDAQPRQSAGGGAIALCEGPGKTETRGTALIEGFDDGRDAIEFMIEAFGFEEFDLFEGGEAGAAMPVNAPIWVVDTADREADTARAT